MDAPLSLQVLFSIVMEQVRERCKAAQRSADTLKTFLPQREAPADHAPPPPAALPQLARHWRCHHPHGGQQYSAGWLGAHPALWVARRQSPQEDDVSPSAIDIRVPSVVSVSVPV